MYYRGLASPFIIVVKFVDDERLGCHLEGQINGAIHRSEMR
jgi:hypothetical protein